MFVHQDLAKKPAWCATRLFFAAAVVLALPIGSQAQDNVPAAVNDNVELHNDVEYGKAGNISLKLDWAKPTNSAGKKLPCIMFVHGGGWEGGNKSQGRGVLTSYVMSGEYVVVSVGYRLTKVAPWPAQIHDCKAAVRWVRANAEELGVDSDRIGVWGMSAGGHLVAMLGTSGDVEELEGDVGSPDQSSRVTCVVDYFGPTDFVGYEGYVAASENKNGAIYKLLGGSVEEKPDIAKQASPITFVTKDDPPFLFLHGTKDSLVPLLQSETLDNKLKEAGVSSTLVVIQGAGHGFGGPEIDARVKNFFAKHLQSKDVTISAEPISVGARK